MDCLVPAGNVSTLPSPCRQESPEALGAAGEKARCLPPKLGQPELPDSGFASDMHSRHLLWSNATSPRCPRHPLLPCATCSSCPPSRADKPGTLKT